MKTQTFTQDEILNSKSWKSANGITTFPNPAEIFNPIIDFERPSFPQSFEIEGTHVFTNVNDDETENNSFGRLNFFKEYQIDEELNYRIGIVFSFDKAKPIVKIYSGIHVNACTNMCIFGADQIIKIDVAENFYSYVDILQSEFLKIERNVERAQRVIAELKSIHFTQEQCDKFNGFLLRQMSANPSNVVKQNPIIGAIKLQSDNTSKYYSEDGLTAWLYYNSLTEYLDKKIHILDIPEKSFEIFNLLKPLLRQGTQAEILNPAQLRIDQGEEEIHIAEIVAVPNKTKAAKKKPAKK